MRMKCAILTLPVSAFSASISLSPGLPIVVVTAGLEVNTLLEGEDLRL